MDTIPQQVKIIADGSAAVTVVAAWLDVFSTALTIVSTIVVIAYGLVRLYETDTVKGWLKRRS